MNRYRRSLLILCLALALAWQTGFAAPRSVQAADPVIKAVLFYSPTCGHCEYVITEVLPPLVEQYGDQLRILLIDVTQPEGQQLYQNTVQKYQITEDRLGVPTLVCGDTVLVGSGEIPELFPGMIAAGLNAGGVEWPDIPDLSAHLPPEAAASETPPPTEIAPDENAAQVIPAATAVNPLAITQAETEPEQESIQEDPGMLGKFRQDPAANTLAAIVLLGMILSSLYIAYAFLSSSPRLPQFPDWAIPALALLGLGVALYLSYVEFYQAEAVCGPVGNCNAVQNSPYAYLFGVLPVGVLGAVGYLAILVGWLLTSRGPESWRQPLILSLWGMAWIGAIFSIYLTFLEPFVIGATCMWCLTSAVVMTLLLWATTPAALQSMPRSEQDELAPENEE